MATNRITDNLFGTMINPAQATQQYMSGMMVNPQQMAALDINRQIAAMGSNAGAMIGTGLGRLFGGRSPEEAQQEQMQGMLGGVDMNDPDSLMEVAQRIQSVNPAAAQELAQRAMTMRKTQVETRAKEAEMMGAQQGYQMRYDGLKSRHPDMTDEVARSLADDPAAFREAMKSDKVVKETAEGVFVVDKNNPEDKIRIGAPVDRRSITTVDARSFNAAESAYGQAVGKDSAERDVKLIDAAEAAGANLNKMYETRQLIESGDLRTGIAAEALLVLDRAKAKFLSDPRAKERVADTEYLDSLLGSDVFPQISALGIGARGLDTPAEREFLRQVITGTISLDRETLKRMTDFRIKSAERAIERYNERLNKGEFDKYQQVTGRGLTSVQKPPSWRTNTEAAGGTAGQTSSGTTYRVIRN